MGVLLRIDSSASGEDSRSRRLTGAFAEAWAAGDPEGRVVERDLHRDPLPHLRQTAQHWPEALRAGVLLDEETARLQDRVIEELLAADALVVGAPMYNYAMPATLKTWIDLVHVPGRTAPFTESTQPLRGKPAVIVSTRGGAPEDPVDDFVVAPLRYLLEKGFGMQVRVIAVSRTLAETVPALGVAEARRAFASALAEVEALAAELCAHPAK